MRSSRPPLATPTLKRVGTAYTEFIELRDGQVWSFGGSSHMGYNSGYITRVDGAEPRPLYAFEPPRNAEGSLIPVGRACQSRTSSKRITVSSYFRTMMFLA